MTEPAKLIDDERAFAHEIMLYVEQLRCSLSSNDEKSIESAKQALIETGVLHADGSEKDCIVSWA